MSVKLDIRNRIASAFVEILKADKAIAALVGTRVYAVKTEDHKAVYPTVTVGIASCEPEDFMTGWYRVIVNLCARTYIADDKLLANLLALAGYLRGVAQTTTLPDDLNRTKIARTDATALTVVAAEIGGDIEEDVGNERMVGVTVSIVARPSTGPNKG